jgi:hypothetical protein
MSETTITNQIFLGDSYERYWIFKNSAGTAIDLTGTVAEFGINLPGFNQQICLYNSTDNPTIVSIPTPTSGTVLVSIAGTLTDRFPIDASGTQTAQAGIRLITSDASSQTYDAVPITLSIGPLGLGV